MNRAINALFIFFALVIFVGCATTKDDGIARWERKGDVPSLAKLAQDTSMNEYTRQKAIKAIGTVGNGEAVQVLIALLRDNTKKGGIFWQVEIPVGKTVRDPRFERPVYLTGKEEKTINVAGTRFEINNITYVYSYYEARQFEEQGAIVKQMDNTSYPVRESACKALKDIAGEDFGMDHAKWSQWWSQNQHRFPKKK